MSRLSDLFGQELSYKASKAAADAVWTQNNGVDAYNLGGKIIAACGAGWGVLSLIPIVCKASINACIWMWVLTAIQLILGSALIILSKKSERFQKWAEKDFNKDLKKIEKLKKKVTIGKVTLPMTYGDILAIKILGVGVILLIVIMGIGLLQGWVVW